MATVAYTDGYLIVGYAANISSMYICNCYIEESIRCLLGNILIRTGKIITTGRARIWSAFCSSCSNGYGHC